MTSEPPTTTWAVFFLPTGELWKRNGFQTRFPRVRLLPPVLLENNAVVVNSADTSVFQTEAEGSMPSGRSQKVDLAQLVEAHG